MTTTQELDRLALEEWEAWRAFCKEFDTLGPHSINDKECSAFVALVRIWAERHAMLRSHQDISIPTKVIEHEEAVLRGTQQ